MEMLVIPRGACEAVVESFLMKPRASPGCVPLDAFHCTKRFHPGRHPLHEAIALKGGAIPVRELVRENCLAVPLKVHDTAWGPPEKEIDVAMNLELDGAWVSSTTAPGQQRWDTSKVIAMGLGQFL